jgi:hypothetical protein
MTQPGLNLVAPDLIEALKAADDSQRHRAAVAAARFALARNNLLEDPTVTKALRALTDGSVGDKAVREAVSRLAEQFDENAWTIQEQVESGQREQQEYLVAFARARAAAALSFALDPDAHRAACEALYEAYHATHDLDALREEARAALG